MLHFSKRISIVVGVCGIVARGYSTDLVNDTWQDGTRTDPAAPTYSENGTDTDGDGDLESAWFNNGATMSASPGHLITTVGSGSSSWTTYFTPEGNEINLGGAGDAMKVTWVFTPTTVNANNTSQNFRMAIVNAPSNSRLVVDGSPETAAYAGYAMFMNMGQTLGNNKPFNLMVRNTSSGDLLSSSGNWTSLANGATSGNDGYHDETAYTFSITFTRTESNELEITAMMNGGTLNGTGTASLTYTDAAPNSFSFDTFALRPSNASSTASQFDTTLFKVEFIPGATAPSISIDPQDRDALVGQDASFNVLAGGTSPLSYQWYYDTNDTSALLLDETNSVLTLTNVQLSDAGGYFVEVTNVYGSVTSAVAQLTVNVPVPPSITLQPQDQTDILPGATATFSVSANGSDPLNYQWYFNTNTVLTNATDSILTITNVQTGNAGVYSVVIKNLAGSTNSANAILTVNTNSVAPVFTTEPNSQVVLVGGTASFTASAAGTAPIYYQWNKNGTAILGATNSTLILTNVQTADDGSYTLTASNIVNAVISDPATLTVTTSVPLVNSAYDLTGFGGNTTGGGVIPETDPAYRKVTNALDFANAILAANKTAGSVKVIEIMTNLNLGWNEVGSDVQNLSSSPFRSHTAPKLHPVLLVTGMSLCDIKPKSGLTIFSANGATIKHCNFNIKDCSNIILRNLKFDENWEWDEASKGQYDENDWDFITLGNGGAVSNVWVDHCTFTKSYDGILDTKAGCSAITISWCKYTGDDGATNPNSWVWQQINYLEQSPSSYPMYNFLRTHGFSTTNIVTIIQGHDKTHLAGQNDLSAANATISMTFHHLWLNSVWDRCVPRLRAGNVHDYNIYVDDTSVLAAKRLRDSIAATMTTANQNTLNNTYDFNPPINGAISTESGALLVENSVYIDCLWPLRNNQTDPSNPEYTGKIESLNSIYQFDSTFVRGNSTDFGNPMGPFQAPVIPFSWNLPSNQLPYTYTLDDPAQLKAIVTSPTAGAGAGVLTWNKTNWLMTTYTPTSPFIVAQPQNQTVAPSNNVTFTALAAGSATLAYQWYFNTNTLIVNATNALLTLQNVQATNAGVYSVTVTNSAGSVTSSNATLTIGSNFAAPQLSDFTFNNGVFSLTINGDSGPNYIVQTSTNLLNWEDIFTNYSPTLPFVWSDNTVGNFNHRFYRVRLSQ